MSLLTYKTDFYFKDLTKKGDEEFFVYSTDRKYIEICITEEKVVNIILRLRPYVYKQPQNLSIHRVNKSLVKYAPFQTGNPTTINCKIYYMKLDYFEEYSEGLNYNEIVKENSIEISLVIDSEDAKTFRNSLISNTHEYFNLEVRP